MTQAQRLDVATPERVSLVLPVAGIGSRTLAYLLDAGAIFLFWLSLYFASSLVTNAWDGFQALSSVGKSVALFAIFFFQWCYWTVCEVALDGQSLGKRLMRIRVVRLDGAPVTPLESALRNLLRAVDFLPFFYAAGVISMLFSRDSRRIGDLVAGTVLVRDERIDLSRYMAAAPAPSRSFTADEHELLLAFLERAPALLPEPRARLSMRLATRYARQLEPAAREAALASAEAAERFLRQVSSSGPAER